MELIWICDAIYFRLENTFFFTSINRYLLLIEEPIVRYIFILKSAIHNNKKNEKQTLRGETSIKRTISANLVAFSRMSYAWCISTALCWCIFMKTISNIHCKIDWIYSKIAYTRCGTTQHISCCRHCCLYTWIWEPATMPTAKKQHFGMSLVQ